MNFVKVLGCLTLCIAALSCGTKNTSKILSGTTTVQNPSKDYDFTGQTPPTAPEGMVWKKVAALSNEFNDGLNTNKWDKGSLWNYGVPVQMREENSGVTNGNLWIKATLDEGAERWFKTSRVQSKMQISYPLYRLHPKNRTKCPIKKY